MKPNSTGALSGCLVWILTFGILSSCLCPLAAGAGTVVSIFAGDWTARTIGPWLCPQGTTPSIEESTTRRLENGRWENIQEYSLICTDANGAQTNLGGTYALVLVGVIGLGAMLLAALLALALAAPAGVVLARLFRRSQPNTA